ncbi:MAG: hypothetical protein RR540_02515 [Oscillospiraceae bacterium]
MKTKVTTRYLIYTIIGFLLLATGAILAKTTRDFGGIMQTLPYIFIGIGAGIFGQNLGGLIHHNAIKNTPAEKQLEIDEKDERNLMIRDKAKAKSFDLANLVYGALMLSFALMQVDISVVLATVGAYLFVNCSNFYYLVKFQKEL